jgi:hypothetical protein
MSTNKLQIAELDFDTIKRNLKNFLRTQSEFQDYDFEGSGLNILLDILAYNTHYNAYYLNMIANESFLDSAILRDSVVSHAKTLGYVPYSTKASRAIINITVPTSNTTYGLLTLPKGLTFKSSVLDFVSYNFVLLNDTTVTKVGTDFVFEDLEIYEGNLVNYDYVYVESSNPKSIFTLPEKNIDTSTIKITVRDSISNSEIQTYNQVTDISDIDGTSLVFFLQEGRDQKYDIYFGDGVLGKKLKDGSVVNVEYLVTSGKAANGIDGFSVANSVDGYNTFFVDVISKSSGGADAETIDEIKFLAPTQFVSQNRLVTSNDYVSYLKREYAALESISVWGGEDEIPPVFGKVFVSLKPKENYFISEAEKQSIINDIILPKSMPTIKTEIRDPEYLFLMTNTKVQYRKTKTTLTQTALAQQIRQTIIDFKDLYLNKFSSTFVTSKLEEAINNTDLNSIIGCDTTSRVQKRFTPTLNTQTNYTINFNIPLLQGTTSNKFSSTEFVVFDSNGIQRTVVLEEVPKSFTGISEIRITDPGVNYSTTPTVTITGDGSGATATATIRFGRIESITVTNPGIDYTTAIVTITGGGGSGAVAVPIVNTKIGTLRTVYYNINSERVIVNNNAGTIDYENGILTLNDLNILSVPYVDGYIRLNCGVQNGIIQSVRNTILTIDENDPAAIVVNLENVA